MINNIFIFAVALFLVIRGATLATKYASQLAETFRLSKYITGFIVIAVISILPEAFIAINATLTGVPSFGLGVLFGSNIADMTLIIAVVVFFAGRSLKVEGKILKNHVVYPFLLLLPLLLGLDGHFSRLEGTALIIAGGIFYYLALKDGIESTLAVKRKGGRIKSILMLLLSMAILLVGSHFVVQSATFLAELVNVSPILIGMLIVGLGATMPEFFFSLKAVAKREDSLAIGDILGTVLACATIVVGILALINPFSFSPQIIYVTGVFMVVSSSILFYCMHSGREITKKEAFGLFLFWVVFVLVEFFVHT